MSAPDGREERGMTIYSNGSHCYGQSPGTLEELIRVLSETPLDPRFEGMGRFVRRRRDGLFRVFGNFSFVSHVFRIEGTYDELEPLLKAIGRNKRTPEYRRLRHQAKGSLKNTRRDIRREERKARKRWHLQTTEEYYFKPIGRAVA